MTTDNLTKIGRVMLAVDAHHLTAEAGGPVDKKALARLCAGLGPETLLSMLRTVDAALDGLAAMNWGSRPYHIDNDERWLVAIVAERERQLTEEDAA